MNEADLIRASQQGDRRAFEALLRLWARPIYAWLLPHVRDVHRAEDLTQEALLRAWKSIGTLDEPAKFKGWFFSIAQAVLIDSARFNNRKKRDDRRLRHRDEINSQPVEPETESRRDELLTALTRLPETYREALSLRFLSGLPLGDIERRLRITNGALRGLLHRGLRMMREELLTSEAKEEAEHEVEP